MRLCFLSKNSFNIQLKSSLSVVVPCGVFTSTDKPVYNDTNADMPRGTVWDIFISQSKGLKFSTELGSPKPEIVNASGTINKSNKLSDKRINLIIF